MSRSKHPGVYRYRGKWHAFLSVDGETLDLGIFASPEAAWNVLMEEELIPKGAYRYGDRWRAGAPAV